jgi:hypothetical protein
MPTCPQAAQPFTIVGLQYCRLNTSEAGNYTIMYRCVHACGVCSIILLLLLHPAPSLLACLVFVSLYVAEACLISVNSS